VGKTKTWEQILKPELHPDAAKNFNAKARALLDKVAQLEREAEARGISRSEAVRRALLGWTREAMEGDEVRITRSEANHRQLMRRLDFLVGMIREQDRRLELFAGRGAGPRPEDGPDAASEGGAPEQSALAEARKRARRRTG
jgi:hypothetical protein